MNRKSSLICILFCMCFIVEVVAQHSMPGVPAKISITSQEVVNAAGFAIETQEKEMQDSKGGHTNKLELIEILEARKLIADGINYQLILKVKVNGEEKRAVANVSWEVARKLTYWKWSEEKT